MSGEERDGDRWMTPRETAAYIGVSVETVRGWMRKRTGPAFTRVGYRTVRYRRSDVDGWMEKRKRTTLGPKR